MTKMKNVAVFWHRDKKQLPENSNEIEIVVDVTVSTSTSRSSQSRNLLKPCLFTMLVSLLQVLTFGAIDCAHEFNRHNSTEQTALETSVPLNSLLLFCPRKRLQIWRFVTYMLVHIGYLHLINNLVFQVLLAVPLELTHKWWHVMAAYMTGVFSGALCNSVFNPHYPLAGASAGVYGLMGAHLANFAANWAKEPACSDDLCALLTSPSVQLPFVLLVGVADTTVTMWLQAGSQGLTRVSTAAHLGGLVGGLVVGLQAFRLPTSKWPWVYDGLFSAFCFAVACALAWNVYAAYFISSPMLSCDICRLTSFNRSLAVV